MSLKYDKIQRADTGDKRDLQMIYLLLAKTPSEMVLVAVKKSFLRNGEKRQRFAKLHKNWDQDQRGAYNPVYHS